MDFCVSIISKSNCTKNSNTERDPVLEIFDEQVYKTKRNEKKRGKSIKRKKKS